MFVSLYFQFYPCPKYIGKKLTAQKIGGRGVANQFINDSALRSKRLPDHKSGMITMQKAPKTSDYDAFASDKLG